MVVETADKVSDLLVGRIADSWGGAGDALALLRFLDPEKRSE